MLNPGVCQLTQSLLSSPSVVFIHLYCGALLSAEDRGHRADRQLLRAGELFRGGSAADWSFWRKKLWELL